MPSHSQHALALWKVPKDEGGKRGDDAAVEKTQVRFCTREARELHQLFLHPVTG